MSLSPSASVTVCTSCRSVGFDSVSVSGSSSLPVSACQMLALGERHHARRRCSMLIVK